MDGQAKSSLMSALIDKQRPREGALTPHRPMGVRCETILLRIEGCPRGEASHPGPQGRRPPEVEQVLDGLDRVDLLLERSTWLTRVDSHLFRVLLSRRLRLPLPLSSRLCRCSRSLDIFGHHRAACSRAEVLGRRGFSVESVAARICREGGARLATNLFVRDMDLRPPNVIDSRRLEVVADWLRLCLEACSWPWTPRWCLLCIVTARLDVTQPMLMELFWRWHDARRRQRTQNWWHLGPELVWLSGLAR